MQYDFTDIGRALVRNRWGWETQLSLQDFIKTMGKDAEILCVLCYLCDQLQELRLDSLRGNQLLRRELKPQATDDPAADALLRFYQIQSGGSSAIFILDALKSKQVDPPSVRAWNILNVLAENQDTPCKTLADLTEERLMVARNCGRTTTREILEWKAAILANTSE